MPDPDELPGDLSPAAELFLIAIDPATGRLVKHKRRRFRKALAASSKARWPPRATAARRAAIKELRARGFVERSVRPGHYPVVSGSGYSKPFARIRRAIANGTFDHGRDVTLFVLLAWTGVLAQRLDRAERKTAVQRLKTLITPPTAQDSAFEPIPPIARALGDVAYRQEMDLVHDMLGDLLSGDSVSVDLGTGADGGGSDGGGGGGGGGGD